MKLALNGALNVCTRDGANLELLERIGQDNLFMFGSTVEQCRELRRTRSYAPGRLAEAHPHIRRTLECFGSDLFAPGRSGFFSWVNEVLLDPRDEHFHLGDLDAYLNVQREVSSAFSDRQGWARRAIHNVARSGWFSSDRAVLEYARNIWQLTSA